MRPRWYLEGRRLSSAPFLRVFPELLLTQACAGLLPGPLTGKVGTEKPTLSLRFRWHYSNLAIKRLKSQLRPVAAWERLTLLPELDMTAVELEHTCPASELTPYEIALFGASVSVVLRHMRQCLRGQAVNYHDILRIGTNLT